MGPAWTAALSAGKCSTAPRPSARRPGACCVPLPPSTRARRLRAWGITAAAYLMLTGSTGCISALPGWNQQSQAPPRGPADSMVLRGDKLEPDTRAIDSPAAAELEGAKRLYE